MKTSLVWIDDSFAPGYRLARDPEPPPAVPAWFTPTGADQHLDPRTRQLTEVITADERTADERTKNARRTSAHVRRARKLA